MERTECGSASFSHIHGDEDEDDNGEIDPTTAACANCLWEHNEQKRDFYAESPTGPNNPSSPQGENADFQEFCSWRDTGLTEIDNAVAGLNQSLDSMTTRDQSDATRSERRAFQKARESITKSKKRLRKARAFFFENMGHFHDQSAAQAAQEAGRRIIDDDETELDAESSLGSPGRAGHST